MMKMKNLAYALMSVLAMSSSYKLTAATYTSDAYGRTALDLNTIQDSNNIIISGLTDSERTKLFQLYDAVTAALNAAEKAVPLANPSLKGNDLYHAIRKDPTWVSAAASFNQFCGELVKKYPAMLVAVGWDLDLSQCSADEVNSLVANVANGRAINNMLPALLAAHPNLKKNGAVLPDGRK